MLGIPDMLICAHFPKFKKSISYLIRSCRYLISESGPFLVFPKRKVSLKIRQKRKVTNNLSVHFCSVISSVYVKYVSWTRFESINASSEAKRAAVQKFCNFFTFRFWKKWLSFFASEKWPTFRNQFFELCNQVWLLVRGQQAPNSYPRTAREVHLGAHNLSVTCPWVTG